MGLKIFGANDSIELVTSAAGAIHYYAAWIDATMADPPVVKGSSSGKNAAIISTGPTDTTIVSNPGAGVMRDVEPILVRNAHATVAQDVTLQMDVSGTEIELDKVNLLPGEAAEYVDGLGFFKRATGFEDEQWVRKAADQTFAATALADITSLGFAIVAGGRYELEWDIIWTTATVTVGVGAAVNGPASPTSIQGTVLIVGGAPATTIGDIGSSGFVAYDSGPTTTSAAIINTNYMARINCVIENGANAGTIIPRWKSETATNTTVKAGSTGTCRRIG